MATVTLSEASSRLLELIELVQSGEVIEIAHGGQVVARLMPPETEEAARQRGLLAVARLCEARQGVSLGRLDSRDLMREGRWPKGEPAGSATTSVLSLARAAQASFPGKSPDVLAREMTELRDEWERKL